jgi:hypothetical protein
VKSATHVLVKGMEQIAVSQGRSNEYLPVRFATMPLCNIGLS